MALEVKNAIENFPKLVGSKKVWSKTRGNLLEPNITMKWLQNESKWKNKRIAWTWAQMADPAEDLKKMEGHRGGESVSWSNRARYWYVHTKQHDSRSWISHDSRFDQRYLLMLEGFWITPEALSNMSNFPADLQMPFEQKCVVIWQALGQNVGTLWISTGLLCQTNVSKNSAEKQWKTNSSGLFKTFQNSI